MKSYKELKTDLSEILLTGFSKQEFVSRKNNDVSFLIENRKETPFYYSVFLLDERPSTPEENSTVCIGRNLSELEALQLCFDFAKNSGLF